MLIEDCTCTSLVATHGIAKHGRSYARTVASRHLRRDTRLITSDWEKVITDGIPFPSDGRDRIDSVSIPSSPLSGDRKGVIR